MSPHAGRAASSRSHLRTAASARGRCTRRADPGPEMASRVAALSATVRATTPSTTAPSRALRQARDAAAAWLQPHEPAVGRGDANRAAPVVGVCDREHARRDGGCRAAARTSGRAARVPRVPRDAVPRVLRRGDDAESRGVCAPAEHESRPRERIHHELARQARVLGGAMGAVRDRPPRHGSQVLDRNRDSQEGRIVPGCRAACRPRPRPARASSSFRHVMAFSVGFSSSTAARQASSSSAAESSRRRSPAASSSALTVGERSDIARPYHR